MLQEAFEKGAVNRLSGGDYAYSYAPFFNIQTPLGSISGDFIGIDKSHSYDFTNVRTVVLRIEDPSTDCQKPTLITGYPGSAGPDVDNTNGTPTWRSVDAIWY